MPMLTFDCVSNAGQSQRTFDAREIVLAGWTGRDHAALQHHIDELAELGVPGPTVTPMFYRCSVQLATQTDRLQVLGRDTSGEVEYVLLAFDDGLWVTVGSDQTDRKQEAAIGIAMSKQLAGKVLAKTCWPLSEMIAHWDGMTLRSWAEIDGQRVLYQESTLATVKRPEELIAGFSGSPTLAPGTILMSGTLPAIGGMRTSDRFEFELACAATGRKMSAGYEINVLPVVA